MILINEKMKYDTFLKIYQQQIAFKVFVYACMYTEVQGNDNTNFHTFDQFYNLDLKILQLLFCSFMFTFNIQIACFYNEDSPFKIWIYELFKL
jgi:hypothetical protein